MLASLTVCSVSLGADAAVRTRQISPGLRLIRLREPGPVRAFVLSVRLSSHPVDAALGARRFPGWGSTVGTLARRGGAVAAINGDLGVLRPSHPLASDGELVQTLAPNSNVFAVSAAGDRAFIGRPHLSSRARSEGPSVPIARWNAGPPGAGEMAAFTAVAGLLEAPQPNSCWVLVAPAGVAGWSPDGAAVTRAYDVSADGCGSPPPAGGHDLLLAARPGSRPATWIHGSVSNGHVTVRWATAWPGIVEVHGGFPLLVRHGRSVVEAPCRSEFCRRQPRTGVGVTAGCTDDTAATGCRVLLVVVDGRRVGWSRGATLPEFARLFVRLGAVAALNLDGGGSSTMLVRGRIVNRPSDTARKVPSALLVLPGPDPGERGLTVAAPDAESSWWSHRKE
jgi:hypothetical protein